MRKNQKTVVVASLLAANLLNLFLFIQSNGSILQVLWIYFIQAFIAAAFYYKRISKIRLAELEYHRKNIPKKATAFEKQVRYQIPHEQIAFIGICLLPLTTIFIFLLSLSSEGVKITHNDSIVGTINLAAVSPSIWAIVIAAAAFYFYYFVEYRIDYRLATQGLNLNNRYSSGRRAIFSIMPLFLVISIGPLLFFYFGSAAVFGIFIAAKMLLDIFLSIRGISVD